LRLAYKFGPFTFDIDSRTLARGTAAIPLTPRAFDLLALLVRERPRAMAKEDLLRALWPDAFVTDGSLSQLVTELRQALGDSAREPRYVRTVFRYGYAFAADAREETPAATSTASPYFVLWRGQEIPLLHGENVIGRDPEARVRLASTMASRRHARIVIEPDRAVLVDLGSRNGTYLGDRRITEESVLRDGDQIVIGDDVIVFCGSSAPTTTRSARFLDRR
jgi:DNA-binding winged helix-turn-helix (wHTH) protein